MKPGALTAVIIAKNEAEMISACIKTLSWCDAILVLDDNSTDQTESLAKKHGAQVVQFSDQSFAQLRTEALKHVKTPWVLYVDADERVTPTLVQEIQTQIASDDIAALKMPRQNIFFGQVFNHGGWERDFVTRVFRVEKLQKWHGKIHESPVFDGTAVTLQTPLIHFSHRDIKSGLYKSASWTLLEAELLYSAGIPRVGVMTILRKGIMEFLRRGFLKRGYKDGAAGMVEAIIQGINRMLVYAQVWELQQQPPVADKYAEEEEKIARLWKE